MLCANPPYIPAREHTTLAPEILDHEPHLALFGGDDGLEVVRRVVADAPRWLSPRGSLIMEIDPSETDAVLVLCEAAGLVGGRVEKDLAGFDRLILAQAP